MTNLDESLAAPTPGSPEPKPYIVSGPLARGGRRYRTLRLATRAVDRLDATYGASAHSWRREVAS